MTEETTAVATLDQGAMALQAAQTGLGVLTPERRDLLKRTVADGCTDDELEMFIEVSRGTGLNPFAKQIYAITRGTGKNRKMTIQTGIDGLRLIAQRTGKYRGQGGPLWCGADGVWVDVWLQDYPPSAAKVGVLHADMAGPQWAVATWDQYVQTKDEWANDQRTGRKIVSDMWQKMGPHMLAKCSEALSLRKTFPQELSAVYANEEMEQAENTPAGNRGAAREAMRNATVAPQGGLRDRIGAPPAQPSADLPQWARDIIDQTQAWGRKMAEFAPLFGVEQVTPGAMRTWGNERLQDGGDPFKEATDWLRAKMQTEAPAAGPADEPIDGEARELPGDADELNAGIPFAPEEASERVLDLPFAD